LGEERGFDWVQNFEAIKGMAKKENLIYPFLKGIWFRVWQFGNLFEFARKCSKFKDANSLEFDKDSKEAIIFLHR